VRDGRIQDRHPPWRAVPAPDAAAQKGIVAVSRVICEIACILIGDRADRFTELGTGYYSAQNPRRQTRSRIREIERLNPGMKVTLTPIDPASAAA